ncbi:Uncharacterised protein [Legionella busanensis]|uniref:Uncharacterized protein n=1 Tax=Legionella busanensis TaxID=190655 RepID=A0A378JKY5_9GAMM|nr:hypothetical protein [Legionella busanensis]STX51737.1 Uncharacterised protein [Legionella busanensis]
MAKGKKRKTLNERTRIIRNILTNRLATLKSLKLTTKDDSIKAIDLLEGNISYSSSAIISANDFLSPASKYKQAVPKGYQKLLKNLHDLQKAAENSSPLREPLLLHEIPLFENTQLIKWHKDGRTNQLNRLVIAIKHVVHQDTKGYIRAEDILKHTEKIWSISGLPFPSSSNKDPFFNSYWLLFKEAIKKYAEIEGFAFDKLDLSGKKLEQIHLLRFKTLLSEKNPQKINTENKDAATQQEQKTIKKSQSNDLERVTDSFDVLEEACHVRSDKQEFTQKALSLYLSPNQDVTYQSIPNILVGRLFIGCGFAGMTLMSTDPTVPAVARSAFQQLRNYLDNPVVDKDLILDTLLISEYKTGHWTKADHRAEQEHPLLEIPGNANAGDFVPESQSINRDKRTNTRHLYYNNTVNMALKDTPPPLFGVKVEKLERKTKHLKDWCGEALDYNFRVKVSITINDSIHHAYIYAQLMEFALGMGEGQNTSFEDACQYEIQRNSSKNSGINKDKLGKEFLAQYSTYDKNRGFTPIIHGNDFDLSNQERQTVAEVKTRRVVVIGGAGGAATAYRISVLGTDKLGYRLQNDNGDFLEDRPGISLNPNVKIFARGTVSYRNLARQATESFEYAKGKNALYEGYLLIGIKVEQDEIVLRFHKREGAAEISQELAADLQGKGQNTEIVKDNDKYYLLNLHTERCDQLISGMGQDASKIRSLVLTEIEENELKIVRGRDGHFVCLSTICESIRFHGAMAGNISRKFTEELTDSLRKSKLPRNGNDQNIMPCVLGKLFSFFSSRPNQPRRVSFNVNTCHLSRGDLREQPTEFQLFLEAAGLKNKEIKAFVNYLLEQRTEDKSGAGISKTNLCNYIKDKGLSNRLEVVSACNLIAVKDLGLANTVRRDFN